MFPIPGCPMPKTPMTSAAAQRIPAMKIGIGRPYAKTVSIGLKSISAPIIPKIAPDAPREFA